MNKEQATHQPSEEERAEFDYFWQHLRRNFDYCMAVGGICWNEMCYSQNPKSRTRHKLFHQRLEFEASCLLPTPIAAGMESSTEALREVLKSKPDFFQTPQWQTIRAKASAAEPVAFWNFAGPHRCAWRDYHDGEKYSDKLWKDPRDDYYSNSAFHKDHHHPTRHDVGTEFASLHVNLEIKEQEASSLKSLEYCAKKNKRTVEDERKIKEAERDEALSRMKRFLEAHPRVDFVADTRLPWATASRALESEWERIKDLRQRVGLERNEQPPRKREWKKQLEVFDAYISHWLKHRKKISMLPRIWDENLSFQESFRLLGVELTPEGVALAKRLDEKGVKLKGIFKFADSMRRKRERDSYAGAATRGLSRMSKAKRGREVSGACDEEGRFVAVEEFDYGTVEAWLDGSMAPGVEARTSSEHGEADLEIFQSWREHFFIPKPLLPAKVAKMQAGKRRKWFALARQRIDSLWPSRDYLNEI